MPPKSLHLTPSFVLSAGTASLDPRTKRVLAVRDAKTNEVLLPKGRKDIGEDLSACAVRETYEESGCKVRLAAHGLRVKATAAKAGVGDDGCEGEVGSGSGGGGTHEPIAMQQRTTADGTLKVIFWFAGVVDSTEDFVEGTQDVGEDFETVWVPFDAVVAPSSSDAKSGGVRSGGIGFTFDDDRQVAELAIKALKSKDQ